MYSFKESFEIVRSKINDWIQLIIDDEANIYEYTGIADNLETYLLNSSKRKIVFEFKGNLIYSITLAIKKISEIEGLEGELKKPLISQFKKIKSELSSEA